MKYKIRLDCHIHWSRSAYWEFVRKRFRIGIFIFIRRSSIDLDLTTDSRLSSGDPCNVTRGHW